MQCEQRLRWDIRDQREPHDHNTTASLIVGAGGKVVADGRVLKSKRPIQREDRRTGIRAIACLVGWVRLRGSALPPVHIVMGEGAVADKNRTALIEDGASESSTPTATATAVATSSERASVSGSAVQINVGANAEACAAAKSAISSVTASEGRPHRSGASTTAAKSAITATSARVLVTAFAGFASAAATATAAVGAIGSIGSFEALDDAPAELSTATTTAAGAGGIVAMIIAAAA